MPLSKRTLTLCGSILIAAFAVDVEAQGPETPDVVADPVAAPGITDENAAEENAADERTVETALDESAADESAADENAGDRADAAGERPVVHAVPENTTVPVVDPETAASEESAPVAAPEPEQGQTPLPEPRRLVLATTLGGLAGVVGGFTLSWGPAFGFAAANESSDDALIAGFVMATTTWGTPLTTAVGIFAAARAAGGRGNYGVTLLGTTLGGVVGAGLAGLAVWSERSQAVSILGVLSIPILEWAGGVLAYHLSHRALSRRRSLESSPSALPSVQIFPGGGGLSWGAVF